MPKRPLFGQLSLTNHFDCALCRSCFMNTSPTGLILALTGIQLFGSGAKFVPLSFYYLRSIALDIYLLQKVQNHKTI
jgi:hypothetical protein